MRADCICNTRMRVCTNPLSLWWVCPAKMNTTEAEFEREAVQMLRNIGLKGVEELNFFQTSSTSSKTWKEGLRKPSKPRVRRFRTDDSNPIRRCASPAEESLCRSKVLLASTNSSGSHSLRHERLTHTKSAPEGSNVSPAACLPERSTATVFKVTSTYIPLPVSRPVQMGAPTQTRSTEKHTETKVLSAQKPSLKILSMESTGAKLVTSSLVSSRKEVYSSITPKPLLPLNVYDRLEKYQDCSHSSFEPPDKETKGSGSPSSLSDLSSPNAADCAQGSTTVIMVHPDNDNESLRNRILSDSPDPATVVIASNPMHTLSTLMDVVTPASSNDEQTESPYRCTGISVSESPSGNVCTNRVDVIQQMCHGLDLSSNNDHVETKPGYSASGPPLVQSNTGEHDAVVQSNVNEVGLDDQDDYFGYCHKCDEAIVGEETGCLALGKVYHTLCLTCSHCQKPLSGKVFYTVDQTVLCEKDYMKSLQRCHFCNQRIKDKVQSIIHRLCNNFISLSEMLSLPLGCHGYLLKIMYKFSTPSVIYIILMWLP
jgi:hypothetical protein